MEKGLQHGYPWGSPLSLLLSGELSHPAVSLHSSRLVYSCAWLKFEQRLSRTGDRPSLTPFFTLSCTRTCVSTRSDGLTSQRPACSTGTSPQLVRLRVLCELTPTHSKTPFTTPGGAEAWGPRVHRCPFWWPCKVGIV